MPLEMNGNLVVLSGHCEITEAEQLLDFLRNHPAPEVDVSGCSSAHMAVLQVLLATAPRITGLGARTRASDWRGLLQDALGAGLPRKQKAE